MKRVCVYCGSSPGAKPAYVRAARELGGTLARRNIGLVYGGARVGMMGQVARAALGAGGEVIGVIPRELAEMDVAFTDLPDLRVVESMHERKALMADLADGFIALPGGLGTIEEFFETLTWAQLGMHPKPCGLLNVCGYYDELIDFLDNVVQQRFMDLAHRKMVLVAESAEALLEAFETYRPPEGSKAQWILGMAGNTRETLA